MNALVWTTDAPTVAGDYFVRHESLDIPDYLRVFTDRYETARFCWDGVWTRTEGFTAEWLGPISPDRIVRMNAALREIEQHTTKACEADWNDSVGRLAASTCVANSLRAARAALTAPEVTP